MCTAEESVKKSVQNLSSSLVLEFVTTLLQILKDVKYTKSTHLHFCVHYSWSDRSVHRSYNS